MRRRYAALASMIILTAVVSAVAAPDFASLQVQQYDPPRPAPAFTLPDLGHMVTDVPGGVAFRQRAL
jgi:hypothetical protein